MAAKGRFKIGSSAKKLAGAPAPVKVNKTKDKAPTPPPFQPKGPRAPMV